MQPCSACLHFRNSPPTSWGRKRSGGLLPLQFYWGTAAVTPSDTCSSIHPNPNPSMENREKVSLCTNMIPLLHHWYHATLTISLSTLVSFKTSNLTLILCYLLLSVHRCFHELQAARNYTSTGRKTSKNLKKKILYRVKNCLAQYNDSYLENYEQVTNAE